MTNAEKEALQQSAAMTGADVRQYEVNALELRALTLWADLQNAAQFLGRQCKPFVEGAGVHATVCLADADFDLVSVFAAVSKAEITEHPYLDTITKQPAVRECVLRAASVKVKGVGFCVQSLREVAR